MGVGKHICAEDFRENFRVNALENLPLSEIEDWAEWQGPMGHEVHFTGGVLPVDAFGGVVYGEQMGDYMQTRNFIGADLMLKEVLGEVRKSATPVPNLVTYSRSGKMLDIV